MYTCPGMRKYPVRYPRGDPVTRLLRFLSHWGYRTAARVAFPTWQTCTAIGITSDLPWSLFLQLGKGISRRYLEKDTRIFKGGVSRQLLWLHDVAISIMLPLAAMSWFCPLNGIKWDNLLKIKALEKNDQSLQFGGDKGISSSCAWITILRTRKAS